MSRETERVYTINLGKALLSQSQHRAVRAINMIKEFARRHMKAESIKIEEELAHKIWERGARSPPRRIRVRMSRTDEDHILVSQYDEATEPKAVPEKEPPEDLTPAEPKAVPEKEPPEDLTPAEPPEPKAGAEPEPPETQKEPAKKPDDKPKAPEPKAKGDKQAPKKPAAEEKPAEKPAKKPE